jgi:23S rRNA pseudouridine2605 synthase
VLSTLRDPWGREGLESALPPQFAGRFHAVGRLDKDTSGLLLFSRDGKLTQFLLHPRRQIPRTYRATIDVDPPAGLQAQLAEGVETALGRFAGTVESIEGRVVQLVVREGKHRMVRRMLHNAGASVIALHRIRYGSCALGDLDEGQVRPVSPDEVADVSHLR